MLTNQQANRLQILREGVWAIHQDRFNSLLAEATKPDELIEKESEIKAAKQPVSKVRGSVGVIPIHGVIGQRPGWFVDASTESIGAAIDTLNASSQVGAIVLDLDSPGGSVFGVHELWQKIKSTEKPVISVVNSMAASAGYYLASAADEIVITPGGMAGSIGVYSMHMDASKAWEKFGVKFTLVHAGEYKVEGNSLEPLGEEAREQMQRTVDGYYSAFIDAVAKGRGVSGGRVLNSFGQGRMFRAEESVERGLADRIGTLEQVIDKLTGRKRSGAASRASDLRKRELRLKALGI